MTDNIDRIEACFNIPHGSLERLCQDPTLSPVIQCLDRCYNDKLSYESLTQQSEAQERENLEFRSKIEEMSNELKILQGKDLEKSDQISKHSEEITEKKHQIKEYEEKISLFNVQMQRLSSEKDGVSFENRVLQDRINDLLNELDNKSAKLDIMAQESLSWCSKYQNLMAENKNLKADLDSMGLKFQISENPELTSINAEIEKKLQKMQDQFNATIDQYGGQLAAKDLEIQKLQTEMKCNQRKYNLISSESTILHEFKSSTKFKCDNINTKISVMENRFIDDLSGLENRLCLIEKYFQSQYEANVEVSAKMNQYLEVAEKMKEKIQNLLLEKLNLSEKLQQVKEEMRQQAEEAEKKLSVTYQEISILKSINQSTLQSDESNVSKTACQSETVQEILSSESLVEKFGSVASNTSKLMPRGLTLSDIYSEYVRQHKELLRFQNDNKLAEHQLKKLLSELDSAQKKLTQQEGDNQSLSKLNESLMMKLNDSKTELLSLNARFRDMKKQNVGLESEVKKLNDVISDLGGQLQILIYHVEKYKDKMPGLVIEQPTNSLPFFTNIAELQSVNCKLLNMIHELEAEVDGKSTTVSDDVACAYHREQLMLKETEIAQINKVIEVTTKQRDMYKMLYQHTSGLKVSDDDIKTLASQTSVYSLETVDELRTENSELKKRLSDKEDEFSAIKRQLEQEKFDLKSEKNSQHNLIRDLNDHLDILRSQNTNLKNNLQSLESKVEAQHELISTLDKLNQESNQEKKNISTDYESLRNVYRALVHESEILKGLLSNCRIENQMLLEDKRKNQPLIEQLQDVSAQLERVDFLFKSDRNSNVDALKSDLAAMKTQLTAISSEFISEKSAILAQLENVRNQLENERLQHSDTSKKLEVAQKTLETVDLTSTTSDQDNQMVNTKTLIENHMKEVNDLQIQIDNYKTICTASENKFNDISIEISEMKVQFERSRDIWDKEKQQYIYTINSIRNEATELKEQVESLRVNQLSMNTDNVNSDEYREKLNQLTQENAKLSEMYSTSVLSHSESIKTVNELKSRLLDVETQGNDLKEKCSRLNDELNILNKKYIEKCKEFEVLNDHQRQDKNAQQQELNLLYEQVQVLRKKLDEFQEMSRSMTFQDSYASESLADSNITTTSQFEGQESFNSSRDIWKLLEFTRNEKLVIAGRLEISQAECARLSTKCAQLFDTVKCLESSLQIERDMRLSDGRLDDITNYRETLENLEILQKENAKLKVDLERYETKISDLNDSLRRYESKQTDLEEQLQALKNSYEEKFGNQDLLTKQLEVAKRNISLLKNQLKQQQKRNSELRKLEVVETELAKCQTELQEYKIKESSHLSLIEKFKTDCGNVKNLLIQKNSENEKLVANIQDLKEKLASLNKQIQLLSTSQNQEVTQDVNRKKTVAPISAPPITHKVRHITLTGPTARKNNFSEIPPKVSNIEAPSTKITLDNQSDSTSPESAHGCRTKTFNENSDSNYQIDNDNSTKQEARQTITGPTIASNTSQTSRFGLSRNILKKDDVVAGKSSIQTIEPPSLSRFKTILDSSGTTAKPTSTSINDNLSNDASPGKEPLEPDTSLEPGEIMISVHKPILPPQAVSHSRPSLIRLARHLEQIKHEGMQATSTQSCRDQVKTNQRDIDEPEKQESVVHLIPIQQLQQEEAAEPIPNVQYENQDQQNVPLPTLPDIEMKPETQIISQQPEVQESVPNLNEMNANNSDQNRLTNEEEVILPSEDKNLKVKQEHSFPQHESENS